MHLAQLRLRNFRNYERLDVEFAPGCHLLLGENAQGKTNILEAIYLLATLRSFRGVGGAAMVRHGQRGYFVGGRIVGTATHEVRMYWSVQERQLTLDGQPVRRLTDYLGTLRVTVFCADDAQLVKGTARHRRRFMDLLLSQTRPGYLPLFQRYLHTLRARNALLRQAVPDEAALDSFTVELVRLGNELMECRRVLLPELAPLAAGAYQRIAGGAETLRLVYQPSVREDFAVELARARPRELARGVTLLGPHLDELQLLLDERPAAQFGSEGQKRSIALALKVAQAQFLTRAHGSPPVLLIDDVMGELDARRRGGFMPLLEEVHRARGQVLMTATEERWPNELAGSAQRWVIRAGTLTPAPQR